MKKILLAVVLGVAVMAGAQQTAQPAQPAAPSQPAQQPAAPAQPGQQSAQPAQGPAATTQAAAPVIKDAAEYNAYVNAIQQTDPNAKISGLEAFLTQYPSSVMKNQALEILMGTYQQVGNVKKTMETATKLVTADACNERGLALLTYFDRVLAQGGDANGAQLSADAGKYGQQGLDCLPKFNKPDNTTDADFQKLKDQMKGIFNAGIGWSALQTKDYPKAIDSLKAAVDGNPPDSQKDFFLVWPLALAYLTPVDAKTPLDPANNVNGIWYAARASALAPAASQAGVEKYAHGQFVKYRQDEEGWPELLAAAKAGAAQIPIKPPLTPADQAHKMLLETAPSKMDFAQWEFVLTNGEQADQDVVWNAIKGKPVQMNGTVIEATADQFLIAGSLDDIADKKADITLTFDDKIPAKLIPKAGASLDFQGNPTSYTPNPFMMTMEKGMLPKPKVAPPAHKPPVHHKTATSQ
jgi:tetratricopeptide (TPR) repeat protein